MTAKIDTKPIYFRVSKNFAAYRLDKYLSLQQPEYSRRHIVGWIKNGQVQINDQIAIQPSRHIQNGDCICIEKKPSLNSLLPVPGPLDIVWQDKDLLVINKPAGLCVHPASERQETTLVHYLLSYFPWLETMDPVRPGIVHRLDRDTSGLMVVVLSEEARRIFVSALSHHQVDKQYLALVHGCPENKYGKMDSPIGRDHRNKTKMTVSKRDGKEAKTRYEILYVFPDQQFSLLNVGIETGRTHQIRVHCAHIGHPVLGDKVYGPRHQSILKDNYPKLTKICSRQMLHSWSLGFDHPINKDRLAFNQRVPQDMSRILIQLNRKTQIVGVTGQVGCGKSSLTDLVAGGNIPKWSADQAVEELYQPGNDGWEMLKRSFGQVFFQQEDGPVDKQKLFQTMKDSPKIKKEVISLIHPLAERHLQNFCQQHWQERRILAEVPLLIESGWQRKGHFDVVVGVMCPQALRWEWLQEKRGWDKNTIAEMESWQLSAQEKLQACNLVVQNLGDWSKLEETAGCLRKVLQWIERQRIRRFQNWLYQEGIY